MIITLEHAKKIANSKAYQVFLIIFGLWNIMLWDIFATPIGVVSTSLGIFGLKEQEQKSRRKNDIFV